MAKPMKRRHPQKKKQAKKLTARQAEYLRETKLYERRLKALAKRLDLRGFDIIAAPIITPYSELKRITAKDIEVIRSLKREKLLKAVTIKKRQPEGLPPIAEVAYDRFYDLVIPYPRIGAEMAQILSDCRAAVTDENPKRAVGQAILDVNAGRMWVDLIDAAETPMEYYMVPYRVSTKLVPALKKICEKFGVEHDFSDIEQFLDEEWDETE